MRSVRELIRQAFERAVAPIVRMSETRANHLGSLFTDVVMGGALVIAGVSRSGANPGIGLLAFASGLLVFSWVEYGFHRWLMHGTFPLLEPGHRKHHDNPSGSDSMPFFLPPMMLLVLVGVFALLLPVSDALLLAGGLACGYAAYGLSHAVIHVKRFDRPLARRWAAMHHIHHHHPNANFGVTTPLWDIVLGTRYVRAPNVRERIKRA